MAGHVSAPLPIGPCRIIWAIAPSGRGEGKRRPMIVVSRRIDILKTRKVFVVVCSTDFDEPLEPIEIRLPSDPDGRCVTRLRKKTVAVCDWTEVLDVDEVQEVDGLVPAQLLRQICQVAGLPVPYER